MTGVSRIQVSPQDGLLDEPRHIRLQGLQPFERVELSSETLRGAVSWQARASFVANAEGEVDLLRDAPVDGDYRDVSGLGLLWSQRPVGAASAQPFNDSVAQPLVTQLTLTSSAGQAHAQFTQRLMAAGVTRREVRTGRLVGTLFLPAGEGPHPAVMVLNGSGGGINEPRAALYASRGYAAFALAYFKAPGLSDYISNTPLEYFLEGLDWLRQEVRPAGGFVALSGQSRGGELVLLLGSLFPDKVNAVIGYVPGALVHGGQAAADPAVGRDGPAWLYQGKPLVHLWNDNRHGNWSDRDAGRRNALSIATALQDEDAVRKARIPVENIRGPVIMLTAGDDAAWPSSRYGRMVEASLEAAEHPWPVQRLDYPEAGHSILLPFIPATYAHDGHPLANAEANRHSWQAVRAFLDTAVSQHLQKVQP
ncbi:acyl-CoA thioesterase/BAAT N-terminal domain-containing protein [Pseudomonas sp. MM211]|uniref:acyl-CoA thioesterase/BAAT N-terminal domain-containing protein n=1 Tax=Pseudomonas sp. MM211 TaxID=2866808 RepID=UPI001CED6AE1|nr:acyl-CoA thioesterase/bile acid-CoA:amino acid N-acyltransferase family protein [Pseudomonas sp. MM211]UCJ16164.1 acyl-CoA thioesterase/BAAT N-terminal domain-containing protein [Pseudomonas sp. MM211]